MPKTLQEQEELKRKAELEKRITETQEGIVGLKVELEEELLELGKIIAKAEKRRNKKEQKSQKEIVEEQEEIRKKTAELKELEAKLQEFNFLNIRSEIIGPKNIEESMKKMERLTESRIKIIKTIRK